MWSLFFLKLCRLPIFRLDKRLNWFWSISLHPFIDLFIWILPNPHPPLTHTLKHFLAKPLWHFISLMTERMCDHLHDSELLIMRTTDADGLWLMVEGPRRWVICVWKCVLKHQTLDEQVVAQAVVANHTKWSIIVWYEYEARFQHQVGLRCFLTRDLNHGCWLCDLCSLFMWLYSCVLMSLLEKWCQLIF